MSHTATDVVCLLGAKIAERLKIKSYEAQQCISNREAGWLPSIAQQVRDIFFQQCHTTLLALQMFLITDCIHMYLSMWSWLWFDYHSAKERSTRDMMIAHWTLPCRVICARSSALSKRRWGPYALRSNEDSLFSICTTKFLARYKSAKLYARRQSRTGIVNQKKTCEVCFDQLADGYEATCVDARTLIPCKFDDHWMHLDLLSCQTDHGHTTW